MSYPLIFDSLAEDFSTQGYGVLSDAIKCDVTEVLNGGYELSLEYPLDGLHAEYLVMRGLVVCRPNQNDERQAFRIYDITEPINNIVTISARHIAHYDLSGVPVEPFSLSNTTVLNALRGLKNHARTTCKFDFTTDKATTGKFEVTEPSSLRSWLGGREGSIIDRFRGEWMYSNYTCALLNHRGTDNGVVIRYGKNLTDYEKNRNNESQYTAVWMYYKTSGDNPQVIMGDIVSAGVFPYSKVLCYNASSHFGSDVPTKAQLNAYAATYIQTNNIGSVFQSIDLDFVQLQDVREMVALGDTVTVIYRGDAYTARIKEVVWDVLLDRYSQVTVGDARTSISDTIRGLSESSAEGSVAAQTNTIDVYDQGGNLIIHGDPSEFYVRGFPHTVSGETILSKILSIRANSDADTEFTVGKRTDNSTVGEWSFVAGKDNEATEEFSVVGGGYNNKATGEYSTVPGGVGCVAASEKQIVLGSYNLIDSNNEYVLIVGDGTDENNRSNLLTLSWDGVLLIKGEAPEQRIDDIFDYLTSHKQLLYDYWQDAQESHQFYHDFTVSTGLIGTGTWANFTQTNINIPQADLVEGLYLVNLSASILGAADGMATVRFWWGNSWETANFSSRQSIPVANGLISTFNVSFIVEYQSGNLGGWPQIYSTANFYPRATHMSVVRIGKNGMTLK